ncbi:ATP-binding cassette domain-containing protein [Streptomyces galilaeus]|uniref:ATP-binding cassette domain-containing protein n=1 Tax=Streptomyces TaxID=1883 RepID=UPI00123DF669|nr:ATP-binding cassette domain-containing protein [Streptomyces galilaeus]QEU68544.1 ATP-binding cassette domain-containing protein [Streptomyces galilaeus]
MIQAFGLTSNPRKDLPLALDDVSFEARAGHVTVLLGAAGAGKTTALRLMLELQQGRGLTYFRGRPLHRIAHPSREVGVLLGDVPGHPARSVRGHLRMLCAAAGVPGRRADEVLEAVGLVSLRDERLGTLSRGMDRRLGLACALLADPHTLVLDHPAEGLSERESRWLHGLLRAHAAQGGTVLSTTPDPKEAARTADRVVTLDQGRLVADQEAAYFARTRLRPRVAVRSPHAVRLAALLTKEARTARRSVEVVQEDGNRLSVYGSSCADIGEVAFRHRILVHQLAVEVGDMGPGFDGRPADATPAWQETGGSGGEPTHADVLAPCDAGDMGDPGEADDPGDAPVRSGSGDSRACDKVSRAVAPAAAVDGTSPDGPNAASTSVGARPPSPTADPELTPAGTTAWVGEPSAPGAVRTGPDAVGTVPTAVGGATGPTGPPSPPATVVDDSPVGATLPARPSAKSPSRALEGALPALPPPIAVRSAPSPLRPVRYELRRACGVSTAFVTGVAVLLVSALTTVVLARIGHTSQARLLAAWPVQLPLPPAALGAGLLGALSFGDEFRHPALAADRGSVPRRLGLLTAKLLVSALTALTLAILTAGCDAELLYLLYGRELAQVPADWLQLSASWLALTVGCGWAGVLAAGVFRSTTAGLAAVVAVPVAVVPLVHKAVESASVRTAAGMSVRLREVLLSQWPFGGDRYVAAALRMVAQPVGGALALSLSGLLCAYLLTTLRSRIR